PHSLAPLRKVVPAAYNARASLLDLPRRTWPDIEAAIQSYCRKCPHWVEPNLAAAKALFDFKSEAKGLGRRVGVPRRLNRLRREDEVLARFLFDPRRCARIIVCRPSLTGRPGHTGPNVHFFCHASLGGDWRLRGRAVGNSALP